MATNQVLKPSSVATSWCLIFGIYWENNPCSAIYLQVQMLQVHMHTPKDTSTHYTYLEREGLIYILYGVCTHMHSQTGLIAPWMMNLSTMETCKQVEAMARRPRHCSCRFCGLLFFGRLQRLRIPRHDPWSVAGEEKALHHDERSENTAQTLKALLRSSPQQRLCPLRQALGIRWKCSKSVELSWRNNLCD